MPFNLAQHEQDYTLFHFFSTFQNAPLTSPASITDPNAFFFFLFSFFKGKVAAPTANKGVLGRAATVPGRAHHHFPAKSAADCVRATGGKGLKDAALGTNGEAKIRRWAAGRGGGAKATPTIKDEL